MIAIMPALLRKGLYVILSIISCSCADSHRIADKSSVFIADLDCASASVFKNSELYDKATAIALRNSEVLLAEISKMLAYEDKLYVLDCKSQGVYAFSKDGSLVRKFGNQGAAPGEYADCKDFAINPDASEIYIFDRDKNKIHQYDISSGLYKASIHIDKKLDIGYITYNDGCIYAAQTSVRDNTSSDSYYLLHQIDIKSGNEIARYFDAASYNKGWSDELLHGNTFYKIGGNKELFVLGLMDTVMCINKEGVFPYLTVKGERLICQEDISEEEKVPSSAPGLRSKRLIALLTRLNAQDRIYRIFNIFEHDSKLYFSCSGRFVRFVQYDTREDTACVYSRKSDDLLFHNAPGNYPLPKFLCADEAGVYYYLSNGYLSQFRDLIENDRISASLVNRECIGQSDEDSNPIILYYEFKQE